MEVKSTCPYCGVGCGVLIASDGAAITSVRGDPDHPANFGKLCSKGSTLHLTARPSGRISAPKVRTGKTEPLNVVSWDAALDLAVGKFAEIIQTHGPDAVAFYGSGQLLTEDYYALNKLARAVVGTNNIDTNSRLCMSSAVAGYKATLGADAVPTCYEDIDSADLLFIAGANTAWAHPIVFRRIEAARTANPAQRMIVVDPRRTETAAQADLHLAILPGTDVALFHAMLHWLVWEDRVNLDFIATHTEGFAEIKRTVREMSPAVAARVCGVKEADILTAARWWAESGNVLSLYCQGLNQSTSGTEKNAALIGLHLATAQIGKAGAGPFSLTGQPNAMGGREVGALANLLPAHRNLTNPAHRAEVAALWGIAQMPDQPGKTAVEMFDAIERGDIKAVWIACSNPAQSMPDLHRVHAALRKAECVVVQDAFEGGETLAFADIVLPATTWGEKSGTVTNSERRMTRISAALPPLAEARADWEIFCDAGRRLERVLHPSRASVMGYASVTDVWNAHCALTAGRDCDITGLTGDTLADVGPQQWPFALHEKGGAKRLYTDHRFQTESGRARFSAASYRGVAERTSVKFPLSLTTGRLRDQWHSMTRTGRAASLFGHESAPKVHLDANDMRRRSIVTGAWVRVSSTHGSVVVQAAAHDSVRSGQAYVPMHWGASFLSGKASVGVNGVLGSAFCPQSKQPELKHAAVSVTLVKTAWHLVAFVRVPSAQLESTRAALMAHCSATLDGVYIAPMQGETTGLVCEAVAEETPSQQWCGALDALLARSVADTAHMAALDDAHGGHARRVWVDGAHIAAARSSGAVQQPASAHWLRECLLEQTDVRPLSRYLLAPQPPADAPIQASPVVCTCFGVRKEVIERTLANCAEGSDGAETTQIAMLQATLQCGTNCGSCLPELRSHVRQAQLQTKIAQPAVTI